LATRGSGSGFGRNKVEGGTSLPMTGLPFGTAIPSGGAALMMRARDGGKEEEEGEEVPRRTACSTLHAAACRQ